jgi:elongation factor Tu
MPTDPFFHMLVQDVFSIRGRGTVVTGSVDTGTLRPGDEVLIRGGVADKKATVTSIEAFRKVIDEARAGDTVGILLKDVNRVDVERGFELMSPDLVR